MHLYSTKQFRTGDIPEDALGELLGDLPIGGALLLDGDPFAALQEGSDWDLIVTDPNAVIQSLLSRLGQPTRLIMTAGATQFIYPWGEIDIVDRVTVWGIPLLTAREALTNRETIGGYPRLPPSEVAFVKSIVPAFIAGGGLVTRGGISVPSWLQPLSAPPAEGAAEAVRRRLKVLFRLEREHCRSTAFYASIRQSMLRELRTLFRPTGRVFGAEELQSSHEGAPTWAFSTGVITSAGVNRPRGWKRRRLRSRGLDVFIGQPGEWRSAYLTASRRGTRRV